MTEPTKINDQFSVAAQISLDDIAAFKQAGYTHHPQQPARQ